MIESMRGSVMVVIELIQCITLAQQHRTSPVVEVRCGPGFVLC